MKVKVCGMREQENIGAIADLHPDYMGFIFYKLSKRYAGNLFAESLEGINPEIKRTGVFVNANLEEIVDKIIQFKLNAVQLHGNEPLELCMILKREGVQIIKAFGVDESFDFSQLTVYQPFVDYFLFDTKTPMHGGSGVQFNWDLLKMYQLETPYFLSGGINEEALESIKTINDNRLFGVDLNSRFEIKPGLKDVKMIGEAISYLKEHH